MPIELPDLDDRNYADLMTEAMASIPVLYPQWSDHNPSNPGIALIELLAWLTDMTIYRTNRIPEKNRDGFLKLIHGPTWTRPPGQDMETAIRETVGVIRERYRAVTTDDYEYLAKHTFVPPIDQSIGGVARVRCLADKSINAQDLLVEASGYVTLLVVPDSGWNDSTYWVDPKTDLTGALKDFFDVRKLVTTRLRVRGPCAVPVKLGATVYLKDDARASIATDARNALLRHFHPLFGGRDGQGWPWGRAVYSSDVYAVLDEVSGIDYVENVSVKFDGSEAQQTARAIKHDNHEHEMHDPAVKLHPHELVRLEPGTSIALTLKERLGDQWVTKAV